MGMYQGNWMYADAGLWPGWLGRALAKEDPLRWSRKMDLEELQEHLTWHAEDWRRIRLWLTALHGTAVESAEYADKTEAVDALRQKCRAAHTECVECGCGGGRHKAAVLFMLHFLYAVHSIGTALNEMLFAAMCHHACSGK